jgi:hypothetical protein
VIRYFDRERFNWPCATLLVGWLIASTSYFLFGGEALATLPREYKTPPLGWELGMDALGFVLVMGPFLLGALALRLFPAVGRAPLTGMVLIALATLSFVGGVLWSRDSGVAVYPDRIIHRQAGFNRPLHVEPLTAIRRVEVSCAFSRGRGGRGGPDPAFELIFADGYRVDVWSMGGVWPDDPKTALRRVRLLDRAASAANAIRGPHRRADGRIVDDAGCITELAELNGVTRASILPLFNVHQSELRPREYTVIPRPADGN